MNFRVLVGSGSRRWRPEISHMEQGLFNGRFSGVYCRRDRGKARTEKSRSRSFGQTFGKGMKTQQALENVAFVDDLVRTKGSKRRQQLRYQGEVSTQLKMQRITQLVQQQR